VPACHDEVLDAARRCGILRGLWDLKTSVREGAAGAVYRLFRRVGRGGMGVPSRCAVTGGSGFVGRRLVEMLIDRGATHVVSFDVAPKPTKWIDPKYDDRITYVQVCVCVCVRARGRGETPLTRR